MAQVELKGVRLSPLASNGVSSPSAGSTIFSQKCLKGTRLTQVTKIEAAGVASDRSRSRTR